MMTLRWGGGEEERHHLNPTRPNPTPPHNPPPQEEIEAAFEKAAGEDGRVIGPGLQGFLTGHDPSNMLMPGNAGWRFPDGSARVTSAGGRKRQLPTKPTHANPRAQADLHRRT